MKLARTLMLLAGVALILTMVNFAIWEKETVLANGRQVLLELRPVDPRSLIQGDYMRLRYADVAFPDAATASNMPLRGSVILTLDDEGVAAFVRADDGSDLQASEFRLRYKLLTDSGSMHYGAESFFFQEGDADLYSDAKYGVLRVDDTGASILIGLADAEQKLIEKPES